MPIGDNQYRWADTSTTSTTANFGHYVDDDPILVCGHRRRPRGYMICTRPVGHDGLHSAYANEYHLGRVAKGAVRYQWDGPVQSILFGDEGVWLPRRRWEPLPRVNNYTINNTSTYVGTQTLNYQQGWRF